MNELKYIISGVARTDGAFDAVVSGIDRADTRASGFSKTLGGISGALGALAGIGVGALGADIANVAGRFETAMNGFQAVTRASGDDFEAVRSLARELGESTAFTASEAANAAEMLAKNGLTTEQILGGALEASLALASASGAGLSESADLITDVGAQFGIASKDMIGTVDTLVGAMNTSKFGFDDFRLAIAQSGGVAGKLGVDFTEFAAALSATSSSFSKGADAGTSFKTFLTRLAPESNAAQGNINMLGLEFFDLHGNLKPIPEIFGELTESLKGLDPSTVSAFNFVQQLEALENVDLDERAEGFNKIKEEIRGLTVASEKRRWSSLISGVDISSANDFANSVKSIRGQFEEMSDFMTIDTMKSIFGVDAIRTALSAAEVGEDGFRDLSAAMGEVSAQEMAETRLKGYEGAMKQLASATEGLKLALADGGFLDAMTSAILKITEFVRTAIDAVPKIGGAFEAMQAKFPALTKVVEGALALITEVWSRTFNALGPLVEGVLGVLDGLFSTLEALITGDFSGAWDAAKGIVVSAVDAIKGVVSALLPELSGPLDQVVSLATNVVSAASDAIGSVIKGISGALLNVVGAIGALLSGDFKTAWEAAGDAVRSVIAGITEAFAGIASRIGEALPTLRQAVGEIAVAVLDGIQALPGQLLSIGRDMIAGLVGGIRDSIPSVGGVVSDLSSSIVGWFKSDQEIQSPSRLWARLGNDIVAGLTIGIQENSDKPVSALGEITTAFDDVGSEITGAFKNALLDGGSDFDSFADALSNTAEGLRDRLLDQAFAPIEQGIDQLLSHAMNGLGGLFGGSGGGGIFSVLGDLFAGFFADGGTIGAGQFGIVGERGPEIAFGGSTPLSITPLDFSRGGGAQPIQVNQTIHVSGLGVDDVERKLQPRFDKLRNETVRTVAEVNSRSPGYLR